MRQVSALIRINGFCGLNRVTFEITCNITQVFAIVVSFVVYRKSELFSCFERLKKHRESTCMTPTLRVIRGQKPATSHTVLTLRVLIIHLSSLHICQCFIRIFRLDLGLISDVDISLLFF